MAKKPKQPQTDAASGGLSDEDVELFRSAMADAERTPGRDNSASAPAPRAQPQLPCKKAGATPLPRGAVASPRLPHLDAGVAAGLDARTMDKLRRGQIRPEARIDLHGMTRKQAHAALTVYMAKAEAAGRRCIIVITGKGRISEGGGALRNEVPGWLNAPAIRPRILGFAEAQPRDGGAGALYVLLKRARGARGTS